MKEYAMTVVNPGRRWRVVHTLPEPRAGVVAVTYYVSVDFAPRTGAKVYRCSCPAGKYGRA